MLLDGLHIPLTTPFYPDGRVYLRKLEHNADRYSRTPATCLTVLSRTGEASLVSDAEAREILGIAIGASAPTKGMIADVSRDGVRATLELADHAAVLGYDAIHLRRPAILSGVGEATKAQMLFYGSIADSSSLPIILEDHRVVLAGADRRALGKPGLSRPQPRRRRRCARTGSQLRGIESQA